MSTRRPRWRRYCAVRCPCCGTYANLLARLAGGEWWIVCPACGECRWRAQIV